MRIVVFLAALGLFGAGVALGFQDKAGAATATYGAAVLCLIFVFLPEFKRFKGLGIEAELLDRKLEEADKLLSQLRDLATPIAEMLLSSVARSGRWDSAMPRAQKRELLQRIEGELRRCGVTEEQLEQAKVDWHYYNLHDLSSPIIKDVIDKLQEHFRERDNAINTVPTPITPDKRGEYDRLVAHRNEVSQERERLRALYALKDKTGIADVIRSAIKNSTVLTPSEKTELFDRHREALLDVEYYAMHKEFRRLTVWLTEDEA